MANDGINEALLADRFIMLSPRRSILYLICVGALLLLLTQFNIFHVPRGYSNSNAPELEPEIYRLPVTQSNGSFSWSNFAEHYPVVRYEPLPSPSSKKLPSVQHAFRPESAAVADERKQRQSTVKKALQRSWTAYHDHAWLEDELAPISGNGKSAFGGWAATLVDTLDTLYIMDLKFEFEEAIEAALQINFSETSADIINVFETTIRYLGGFLAAYDLSGDKRLLDKSLELAQMLYAAFDTPNRMPITRWHFHRAVAGDAQSADESVLAAEIGSLTLEFTRLAQITHDPKWYDAVARIITVFDEQQQSTNLPGMWPLVVNAREQKFNTGSTFTLGAMSDSLYEYFPKMYALLGGSDMYARLYTNSMDTAIKHALFRPMLPDEADVLMAGPVQADEPGNAEVEPQGQHLVCFAGAMLALGGRLLGNDTHVSIGRKLTDGCVWTYENSELGIMPETFNMLPCERMDRCAWDQFRWHRDILLWHGDDTGNDTTVDDIIRDKRLRHGFSAISDRRYLLRPEAVESVFVLYRITGDTRLQDKAWMMFNNIYKYTETDYANAALEDMTDPEAPQADDMESFWTAETLKYFYLVFSEPSLMSLDEYVFNTEAHPFKRPS